MMRKVEDTQNERDDVTRVQERHRKKNVDTCRN